MAATRIGEEERTIRRRKVLFARYPRLSGNNRYSHLRTDSAKFGRENAAVTRGEKILVIGAGSFQVSGAFPTAWHLQDLSLRFCRQTTFLPLCLLLSALSAVVSDLSSFSLLRVACTTNFCLREQRPNEPGINSHPKVSRCVYRRCLTVAIAPCSTSELRRKTYQSQKH